MSKIDKDIHQLLEAGVIDNNTALRIENYYESKRTSGRISSNNIISILGALLVGAGVILLVAHNWDELSRTIKLLFAALPLIIGYVLCAIAIVKNRNNIALNESAAIFTTMALGALISLISQIYNIPGSATTFLFIWIALSIPLIYLMRSALVSLLTIVGMVIFMFSTAWSYQPDLSKHLFWILFLAVIPFYINILKTNNDSHSIRIHNWFLSLALILGFWITAKSNSRWDISLLFSFLTALILLREVNIPLLGNHLWGVLKQISIVGIITMLTIASFTDFWEPKILVDGKLFLSKSFIAVMVTTAIALNLLLVKKVFNKKQLEIFDWMFVPVFLAFIINNYSTIIPVIIINLLLLTAGIYYSIKGVKTNSYKQLNTGLTIISILIFCRFFDSDIPFVLRGVIFITVGLAFLFANIYLSKKLKTATDEKK